MHNYLMLILADILLAVNIAVNKIYQQSEGTTIAAGFKYNFLAGLFTTVEFLIINGFRVSFTTYSCMMALVKTILVVAYTILGFRLLKLGSMALYTLFLMIGGMTIPYIWGLAFLDEPFSWLRTAALVLILAGVVLANFSKGKVNFKMIIMCVAVFIMNGFVSVVSKLHQIEEVQPAVTANDFVLIGGIIQFVLCGAGYVITRKSFVADSQSRLHWSKVLLLVAVGATLGGVSYLLQLFGAEELPATVVYPFVTGGSIIFSTLMGVFAFKEKISAKMIISVCLCFVGTLMFL